jgi:hypothetical protein
VLSTPSAPSSRRASSTHTGHAWETQLRRIMPDVDDLGAHVMSNLAGYATTVST